MNIRGASAEAAIGWRSRPTASEFASCVVKRGTTNACARAVGRGGRPPAERRLRALGVRRMVSGKVGRGRGALEVVRKKKEGNK